MKTQQILRVVLIVFCSMTLLTGFLGKDQTPEQAREEIQQMRTETLKDLYNELPGAKEVVENSVGYAVFSNIGINLLAISTANGKGVAFEKETGKDTFMKMFSAGLGVGAGLKDFRAVFVFTTKEALHGFVNQGWQAAAQADAAAKSDDKGDALAMAIDVAPGIKLYQLTEAGVALQATLQGTKYWKDDELNQD